MSEHLGRSETSKRDAKLRIRVERHKARMERKVRRRRQWRCFWTWPLGHAWENEGWAVQRCAVCGKDRTVGNL